MSVFPIFSVSESLESSVTKSNDELEMYREIAWDYKNDLPIIKNGEFQIVEGNDAIKVWCYKAIKTVRYQYPVYSWDYGCEINSLIGQKYSIGLTKSEAERFIKESLLINKYILDVKITDIDFTDCRLSASINVKTIYGEVDINV